MERWKLWKNIIIFGVDNGSSVHIDDRNRNILVLGERSTQGLEDATITEETKYPINSTEWRKRFALGLHYNGSNSFLFVNRVKINLFRGKDWERKLYLICLRNILKDFTFDKTGWSFWY